MLKFTLEGFQIKVFLSGCHGVGKTTIVNKIRTDLPLVKIVDSDLLIPTGQGYAQQILRLDNNYKLIKQIEQITYPVIIDRYFGDNSHYMDEMFNRINFSNAEKLELLRKQREILELLENMRDIVVVYIDDSFENIWKKILSRGRESMMEDDRTWSEAMYKRISVYGKKHFHTINVNDGDKLKPFLY